MPKTKKRKYNFKKYKSGDPNDMDKEEERKLIDLSNPLSLNLNLDEVNEDEELLSTEIDERWIEEKSKNGELEVFRDHKEKKELFKDTNFYMAFPPPEEGKRTERFESFIEDYINEHIFIKVPYKITDDPRDFYVYAYHIKDCNNWKKGNVEYVCDGQAHPSNHLADLKNRNNPFSTYNKSKKKLTESNNKKRKEYIEKQMERLKKEKERESISPSSVFDMYNLQSPVVDITGKKRSLSPTSTPRSIKINAGKKRKRRKTLKRKKRKSMKRKNKK